MQKLLDTLRRPVVIRISVALYVACLCVLIFIYFVISAMQVPTAIYLRGPERLSAGDPLVLRGHVLDVATGQKIRKVKEIDMVISCPSVARDLPAPEFEPDGELRLNHALDSRIFPDATPLECQLQVSLRREAGAPLFESSSPLMLLPKQEATARSSNSELQLVERRVQPDASGKLPRLGVTREDLSSGEGRKQEREEEEEETRGDVRIDLVERYPVLGRGLPGHVTLRTTERSSGAPRSCEILFKTTRGILDGQLPTSMRTDRLGLARVELTPSTLQVLDLEAFCSPGADRAPSGEGGEAVIEPVPDGSARIQLDVATTQFQFARHKVDPFWRHGAGELLAGYDSVYKEGQVVVDFYRADTHLYTGRHGFNEHRGGVRVPLMEDAVPGLHRVQIYHDAYQPGTAWDILYVWRARGPEGANRTELEQAIEDLLQLHLNLGAKEDSSAPFAYLLENAEDTWRGRDASKSSQRKLFEALLHGLPPTFAHAPVLLNSFDLDQRELDTWKQGVRSDLLLAVAAALLTGLAMLSLAILSGISQRQARQRLYDEVALEHGEAQEDEVASLAMHKRQRAEKIMLWVQGGVLFGTLVVFAACIWMLMRYMM